MKKNSYILFPYINFNNPCFGTELWNEGKNIEGNDFSDSSRDPDKNYRIFISNLSGKHAGRNRTRHLPAGISRVLDLFYPVCCRTSDGRITINFQSTL